MRFRKVGLLGLMCAGLGACGLQPVKPSDQHISGNAGLLPNTGIPAVIKRTIPLPAPAANAETYNVVVTNVPAEEILFALARDAKINLDIHNGIQGTVTLNAIEQTLPRILSRMAKQVDMRYELDGSNLIIMPDTPYLKHYKIDYVNMLRDSDGTISNTTQLGSTGSAGNTGNAGSNNASLTIKNVSKNHFWETLIQNIKDILHETDMILPAGSSETVVQKSNETRSSGAVIPLPAANSKKKTVTKTPAGTGSPEPSATQEEGTTVTRTSTFREAAAVIANPESGIITVRATGKQHERIAEFVDRIMSSVRRQVLIEATVVEVRLNDQYQQGINWSMLRLGTKGFQLTQAGSAGLPATSTGSLFTVGYANPSSVLGSLSAQISLLESFGKVKVLSSPKLSVLNNQTAMLRVVDNLVYGWRNYSMNVTYIRNTNSYKDYKCMLKN
jgi:general secretion pathway protein D